MVKGLCAILAACLFPGNAKAFLTDFENAKAKNRRAKMEKVK